MNTDKNRIALLQLANSILSLVLALGRIKKDAIDSSQEYISGSFDEDLKQARVSLESMLKELEAGDD